MAPRRSKEEARAHLLDAGQQEFLSSSTGSATNVLAHLKLEDVATRAGYSGPGMIYNLWKDDESGLTPRELYLQDLLVEVARAPYQPEEVIDSIGQALEAEPTDFAQAIRVMGNAEFTRLLESLDEAYRAFWILISGLSVDTVANSLESIEADALAAICDTYQAGLDYYGRRMVPPLTVRHLALALRSVQSGMAETYAILVSDRELMTGIDWNGSDDWSLFAIASLAIIEGLTEPND